MPTADLNIPERDRDVLVRCIADAYEAIALLPGVEPNGPVLVWLADQLLQANRRAEKTVGAPSGAR